MVDLNSHMGNKTKSEASEFESELKESQRSSQNDNERKKKKE